MMDSFDRYRRDVGGPGTYHNTMGVFSRNGSLGAGYLTIDVAANQPWPEHSAWKWNSLRAQRGGWPERFRFLGFVYWNATLPVTGTSGFIRPIGFAIPYWLVTMLLAVPPAAWARHAWLERRRRRRLRAGLCAACGYDVRASGDRCPECGIALAAPLVPSPGTPGEG